MDVSQSNILFYKDSKSVDHLMQFVHDCGFKNIYSTDNHQQATQLLLTSQIDLVIITKLDDLKKTIATFINYGESNETTDGLPLVVITQNESITSIQKIMAQGVNSVLIEPVNHQTIQNTLSFLLFSIQDGIIGMAQLQDAQQLIEENKPDEAVIILQDLVGFPDFGIEVHVSLCKAAIKKKDNESSASTLKELIKIAKATEDQTERHIRLSTIAHLHGKLLSQRGSVGKALEQYKIAYDLHPYNVDNLVSLISLLPKENKVKELENILKKTVFDFLSFSKPLDIIAYQLSETCEQLQKLGLEAEVLSLFNILLKIDHKNIEVHQKILFYCVKQGKYSLILDYAKYIITKVKDPELFYNLARNCLDIHSGKIEFINKEDDKAESHYEKKDDLENNKQLLYLAKEAIQQVVFWEPDAPKHRVLLAIAEFRLGNEKTTETILLQVKEEYQNDLEEYAQVIRELLDEKMFPTAFDWLESAEDYFPDSEIILKLKSEYFCCVGEPLKAVRAIKIFLLKDSKNVELIVMLSEIYIEAQDKDNALIAIEKAKKIAPDNQRVIKQMKAVIKASSP
ncbi:MAG: hypothetical protein KZQ83_02380 [gamma proteobacterium symbiont of Taylorina sp.]|nr:hypothetical protein [gamma proteobacterium symbiont of Taylorina sp.]